MAFTHSNILTVVVSCTPATQQNTGASPSHCCFPTTTKTLACTHLKEQSAPLPCLHLKHMSTGKGSIHRSFVVDDHAAVLEAERALWLDANRFVIHASSVHKVSQCAILQNLKVAVEGREDVCSGACVNQQGCALCGGSSCYTNLHIVPPFPGSDALTLLVHVAALTHRVFAWVAGGGKY